MREMFRELERAESAVEVVEVGKEYVTLDVPESVHDAPRAVPYELVEFGQDARNWFVWDMAEKQPRAPHNGGYAGKVQWGRPNVAWDNRAGGTFEDVMDALDGNINGHVADSWRWGTVEDEHENEVPEEPRELYPMAIVPHADFSPEPGLMFFDFDDVVELQGDGTAVMTREVWDIIQRLDCYAELSTSLTGVHCFALGEMPARVDGKKVLKDLSQPLPGGEVGHIEIYGYPANGRVMGTTWMHIDATPRHTVTERQETIDALADELLNEEDTITDGEQAHQAFDERTDVDHGNTGGGSKSAYYGLNPEVIANTGPFSRHGRNGQGPHPTHGGTSTPDSESTNFGVDADDGWKCWAHDDGGGALQLIAVIEDIRQCGNASDVMGDPIDAFRVCLAARDKHASAALEDENPPTQALRGVLEIQGVDYNEDGRLSKANYALAIGLFEEMEYTG